MIKTPVANIMNNALPTRLLPLIILFAKAMTSIVNTRLFSEDTVYKWHFLRDYMPELYLQHTAKLYANCVFCANLVVSGCHKHCLKCSVGTYIHCSPLLPGALYCETSYPYNNDYLSTPWYYKEPCSNFKRLPQTNYFKNLYVAFSAVGVWNFEVLEGLEKGLLAGEKPCHICASIDYELYKKCAAQVDFDASTPCHRITTELSAIFTSINI